MLAIKSNNFLEISDWVMEYARWSPWYASAFERFGIGIYQIWQNGSKHDLTCQQ